MRAADQERVKVGNATPQEIVMVSNLEIGDTIVHFYSLEAFTIVDIMDSAVERFIFLDNDKCVPMPIDEQVKRIVQAEAVK